MLFTKILDVADNEKAFLFEKNRFARVLGPGRYRHFDLTGHIRTEKFDITQHELVHYLNKFLVSTFADLTNDHIEGFQLTETEVGLLYRDDKLVEIVAPGSFKVFWKGPEKTEMIRIDISEEFAIPEVLLKLLGSSNNLIATAQASKALYCTEVEDNHVGMLQINGKHERMLQSGSHGFWKYQRNIVIKHIDLRLQNLEISGQEILTKDRVSLRLNLSAAYRIENPQQVQNKLAGYSDYLYREFQLQLREAVGTRTLDQLLTEKDSLNQVIADGVRQRVQEFGIAVKSVGVRDIILPGDMKTILNQVVEAEKSAEANLIKRREETAATRSLHNTAKMIEGNPTLMRLKELETLEKVTERIGNINVYSGLEGVLKDVVKSPPHLGL